MFSGGIDVRGRITKALFAGFFAFALVSAVEAAPRDGRVVEGSGRIESAGTHTDIHQQSDFLATRWGSFNIGANESVQAHQPSSTSRLLIRVDGGGTTNIAGTFTANGITILENQNGVQFSRGAIVNVGGLLATSSRISGADGNHWQLNGTGGAVINHGQIVAGAGGAILAAVKVQNTGDITSKGGDVALGAGSSFTVDFAGSMVGFEVTQAASGASITNSGKIEAQGGVVALSAQEAQEVRTNVVSVGGVVKATRIERRGGVIYLSGGDEGVAEVSGDIQASEQIQTTGEYVVVKEGAVLTAPDILVGGDFQGRDGVQTAKRTLVERGALLDAGQEGRVIVWSDDVTWFNGNINVPDGFAEVSGKGNLAAVNLPGINVGASGKGRLLLDPLRIIIDATSTTTLGAGVLFADNADGDTNINAADIAGFTGALELQARGGIRVTADIISTSLTSLTLRAQDDFGPDGVAGGGDDGPDFTGNGDANNIGFFGTTTLDLGEASLTLIAGVVNIRNGAASTITARGGLTFRFTRDGFNLATAEATHVTGFTAGANTTLVYAFGLDGVADNISATAINCAGQTSVCSITRAADEDVQISSGNLSASESLTIDISRGTLTFAGTGLITISAPTVSITAGSLDIGTRNLIIEATGGSLTLNTPIFNGATGVGASRVLRAVNGPITIGGDIAAAGNGNSIDSDLTISSTGTGAGIILGGDIELRGRSIELTGAIAGTEGTSRGLDIRTVGGNITLHSDINLRGGTLDLRTPNGMGNIITTGEPTIMVGKLSLREGNAVGGNGYIASLFNTDSRATGEVIIRVGATADITIHPWMAGLNAGSFELRGVGGATITMLTLPASFVSTGNITLTAAAIALSGDATTILSGAAVTLTGDITGTGALNLTTTTGTLTLNSGIAIGGALAIIAGERINLATPNTVITAGGAFTINFTDPDVADNENAGFSIDGGTTTTRNNFAASSSPPTITFIPDIPDDDCISNGEACSLIRDDADLETADADLRSDVSIMIRIGSGTLTFGGAGLIMISAPTVSITAGSLDIGTRNLIIEATNGSLTLNTLILNGAVGVGASRVLRAMNGPITIGGNIGGGVGTNGNIDSDLTISSMGTGAGIILVDDGVQRARNMFGRNVELIGEIVGVEGTPRNLGISTTGMGNITLHSDINLHGGMLTLATDRAGGRIITTGSPTINVATLNLLEGGGGVTETGYIAGLFSTMSRVTGTANIVVGRDVTAAVIHPWMAGLNAASFNLLALVDSTPNVPMPIPMVTLPASFVSTGNITLVADAIALSSAMTTTLSGAAITLIGAITDTRNLTITATDDITLNSDIDIDTGALILTSATGNIVTPGTPTLTASMVSLTQASAFSALAPFTFMTPTLNLTATTMQTFRGWMVDRNFVRSAGVTGRNLNLTGAGITLTANVNAGGGNLTLAATGNNSIVQQGGAIEIRGAAITLTGLFDASVESLNLTITATDDITLNSNIDLGDDGNLTLTADGNNIVLGNDITLTGSAITLTGAIDASDTGNGGNHALTVMAGGVLTLNDNINTGAGALSLSSSFGGIALGGATITLTGGFVTLTGAIDESTDGDSLTIEASGTGRLSNLVISGDINLGAGVLTLTSRGVGNIFHGGTAPTLTASTVSLTQDVAFFLFVPFTFVTPTLNLEAGAAQPLRSWIVTAATDRTLNLTAAGDITLARDVNVGGGNLTLTATGSNNIVLQDDGIEIRGAAITLTGAIASNEGFAFTITATGDITLNSNINLDDGNLTLTATGNNIVLGGDITLTGGAVMLTGAIDGDNPLTVTAGGVLTLNSDIDTGAGALSLSSSFGGIALGGAINLDGAAITLNGAIDESGNDALTVTATGALTLHSDINTGAGALSLTGATIALNGDITLEGGAVSLMGALTSSDDLTLTAGGRLTLNSGIDLGSGNLVINASERINVATPGTDSTAITAGTLMINFADSDVQDPDAGFTIAGTSTLSRADFSGGVEPVYDYADPPLPTDCSGQIGSCTLTRDNADLTITTATLTAPQGSITIAIGTGTLDFIGIGAIEIRAQGSVSITAGMFNVGSRSVTIIATGGTLRLGTNIATAGNLTLSGADARNRNGIDFLRNDITLSGADISLTGEINDTLNFTVTASGVLTLNSDISVLGNSVFSLTGVGGITLGNPIELTGAMITLTGVIDGNNGLTIINTTFSNNTLTLNSDINTGTGDLTLSGNDFGSIVLGSGLTSLAGAAVTLTGAMSRPSGTADLTITAAGALTLNDNIDIGTAALSLSAGAGAIMNGDTERALTAGTVSLTQVATFDPTALFTFGSATSLTLATGADQIVHNAWMLGTNRALSLTTTGAITVNEDINTGTSALTLSGTSIFLRGVGGTRTLMGSVVTLTGILDSRVSGAGASANNIIITAGTGNITITGSINASGNVGAVDSIGDGETGGNGGTLTFTADNGGITITGNVNTNGARGGDGIGSDIFGGNSGNSGDVMINAGGMIQIGNINTNGGRGGNATGAGSSGRGGNGGAVDISGSVVTVGSVNATGGTPGSFDGGNSGSSGADGTDGRAMITATGGNLTLGGDINVDGGTITLIAQGAGSAILNGGDPRTLTASTVSLTQVVEFVPTAPFTFGSSVGAVNFLITMGEQRIRNWMMADDRSLSVHSIGGPISLLGNIEIGAGDLTLNSLNGILFGGDRTLSGRAITLTGAIRESTRNLIITATGQLTLNSNITVRNLTLTAGNGGDGNIMGSNALELAANQIDLTQDDAFGATFASTVGGAFALFTDTLNLTTATDQTVHDWMNRTNRTLSLTTTGEIMIGRDIIAGSGNITLDGGTLAFSGAARTLSGTNITLTGAAMSTVALTLNAAGAGTLTLNSDITTTGATSNLAITGGTGGITTLAGITLTSGNNLSTTGAITTAATNGALTLNAEGTGTLTLGGAITLGTGTATLRAGSATGLAGTSVITAAAVRIEFSDTSIRLDNLPSAIDDTITFVNAGGMVVTPDYQFGALGCASDIDCVIMGDGEIRVQHNLMASTSITIEATGSGSSVTFGGARTDTITLRAPMVTIIADMINLAGRDLMIVDAGGATLTLAGDVSGAAAINVPNNGSIDIVGAHTIAGGAITLTAELVRTVASIGAVPITAANLTITATDGLTITTNINTDTAALTLTAGDGGTGDIAAGSATPTLTAGTVSLTQAGVFGATALFTFTTPTLNLTTTVDQIVHNAWMAVNDRNLSVISTGGAVIINANINIGTGNLNLNGMGGITLGGAGTVRRLIGGAITLTGAIDTSSTNIGLFARASGALTINSDITTGTGNLTLDGTSILLNENGDAITLSGGAITLTGAVDGDQTTNDNDFTITATGNITINGNINLDSGALTLTAGMGDTTGDISNGGDLRTLTASTVSLTQDGAFADGLLDIASATSLTLTTTAAQIVYDWMLADDRNLSLTSTGGAVIVNENINIATGNLNLNGMGGITLGGSGVRRLIGGDVTLTGVIDASGTNVGLFARASGALTLNSNINTGTGALTLNGATITLGGTGRRRLIGGAITLTGAIDASSTNVGLLARASGALTINNDINTGTGALTLEGASIATTNTAGLTLTGGAIELIGTLNTSNAVEGGAPVTITASGALTINNNIVTNLAALTLGGASIVLNSTVRLAGGTIMFNGEIDGTTCGGCTLRAIGRAGNITFNENVDLGTGVIILLATGGNIASGSTPPIMRSRNLVVRQEGAFSADLFSEASLITNAVRLFINDASATQTIHPWLATLSGSVFALGGFNATLASITTTTAITNSNRIELRAATITLGGVITSANVSLRTNMIAGMVDIRATTGNIAATDIIAAGAAGTGVPTLATTITSLTLRQNGAFGAAAPFTFGVEVTALTLETAAAQTYAVWMRGGVPGTQAPRFNLSLTSTGGVLTLNDNINVGTGDLTLSGTTITLGGSGVRRLIGSDITLTGAIDTSGTNNISRLLVAAGVTLTLNSDINTGTGDLILRGETIFLRAGGGTHTLIGGNVELVGDLDSRVSGSGASANNIIITAATGDITITGNIITTGSDGTVVFDDGGNGGNLTLTATGGSITVSGNINTDGAAGAISDDNADNAGDAGNSGNVMINADGTVQIRNINANGGTGGDVSGGSAAGDGGNGGMVNLSGSIVTVGVINARGGNPGGRADFIEDTPGSDGADGQAMITATGGNLTLNGNINVDGGTITLIVQGATAAILNGGDLRTLTANTVSLTQVAAFGDTALFTFTTPSLILTIATAQTLHGWMVAGTNRDLSLTSTGVITITEDAINLGTGNLTLSGASLAAINMAGLTITAGAVELTGVLNTSNAAVDGAPVTITASGALTINNNIVTNLAALTLGGASIVFNRNVRLAGGTITFNGEIDGTACVSCTLRAIGRAGNITFNENVDFGTGVIVLNAAGGNIASGSTPPIIRSRNLVVRQDGAFSVNLFSEASLVTNAVRLFINDAATTQTIHPWLATLSGSVFALGGFNATLASITTTTAITNSNRIELRAALITLGGVITSANVSLRTNMIAGMVDIRATTGNIAATDIIAAGAAGTGVPTLATTVTSLALRQNGAFGAAAPFTFGAEVTVLTLETTAAQTYEAWMRADDRNLSLTSTGGAVIVNDNINVAAGDLTLSGTTITLGGSGVRRLIGGAITLTGVIDASGTNVGLLARANVGALTLNDNINVGTGNLTLEGATITLGGMGRRRLIGGAITLTGAIDTSSTNNVGLLARASVGELTINSNIDTGTGDLTLEAVGPIVFAPGVDLTAGSFGFAPPLSCTDLTTPRCTTTP